MTKAADSYRQGLAFHEAGNAQGAFSAFLMALALEPQNPAYRRMALHYLGLASGYSALPDAVLQALDMCAADQTLDAQPLSLVVKNLLEGDPRLAALRSATDEEALEADVRSGRSDWFLKNNLLRAVLSRALNISLPLEQVFTALRRHACLRVSQGKRTALLQHHGDFFTALALQCHATRFAWKESPDETDSLHRLEKRNDAEAVLVKAAYRAADQFPVEATAHLPRELRARRRATEREKELAEALPQITPIADPVSLAVAAQYAAFPYPPWEHISAGAPHSLGDVLRQRYATFVPPKEFDGPVNILSAGCGTGFGAIQLALTIKAARINAVDLSRPSLAFAARKAEEMKCTNVAFGVADILRLPDARPDWRGYFHMIDCTGVLHHMADPSAGLAALTALLRPSGVMRLAFYSRRGRTAVVAARDFVGAQKFPDTADGVRAARFAIAALPDHHPARGVMTSPEFFSLDGLHDLIFNVQELRYHPRELKALLSAANLGVFGVVPANPALRAAFTQRHPDPASAADLDAWDAFEADNPDVFSEMILLWCRPAAAGQTP